MILYAVVMFLTSILFSVMARLIYIGKTNLIHDCHQTKVTDKAAYGRSFGKAMVVIAVTAALSGVISLFGSNNAVMCVAVAVLVVGLIAGVAAISKVQKQYNGGLL